MLKQKVTKIQDLIKFQRFSMSGFYHAIQAASPVVFGTNIRPWVTGSLLYGLLNALRTKTFLENLLKFYNVDSFSKNNHLRQYRVQRIWGLMGILKIWDRPYRNFTTDVADGKKRRHVRSKTPAFTCC